MFNCLFPCSGLSLKRKTDFACSAHKCALCFLDSPEMAPYTIFTWLIPPFDCCYTYLYLIFHPYYSCYLSNNVKSSISNNIRSNSFHFLLNDIYNTCLPNKAYKAGQSETLRPHLSLTTTTCLSKVVITFRTDRDTSLQLP